MGDAGGPLYARGRGERLCQHESKCVTYGGRDTDKSAFSEDGMWAERPTGVHRGMCIGLEKFL